MSMTNIVILLLQKFVSENSDDVLKLTQINISYCLNNENIAHVLSRLGLTKQLEKLTETAGQFGNEDQVKMLRDIYP